MTQMYRGPRPLGAGGDTGAWSILAETKNDRTAKTVYNTCNDLHLGSIWLCNPICTFQGLQGEMFFREQRKKEGKASHRA